MENRKQSIRGKLGVTKPAAFTLVKALQDLREKNRKTCDDRNRYFLGAREMMILGRLINSWKDVVGLQLAHKTCPTRLMKGCLYLTVSDSQWMQTLLFLKGPIIEKLNQLFPDIKIHDIIGRPGEISEAVEELLADADWPDWQQEQPHHLPTDDVELAGLLERCQRKLDARLRGLRQRGFELCRNCEATVTDSPEGICAVCVFATRERNRAEVRALVREMPWLTLAEVHEFDEQLSDIEFSALKLELLENALAYVKELATELLGEFSPATDHQMRKEMVRAVMLYTGCMPDEVDLEQLEPEQMPESEWPAYLSLKDLAAGEQQC